MDKGVKPTMASLVIGRLRRSSGRTGAVADDLPLGLAVNLVRTTGVAALRGLARTRQPVFIGPNVVIRGKRNLCLGRGASIGRGTWIDGYARRPVSLGAASRLGSFCVVTCTSHVQKLGSGFTLGERSGLGDFCHVGAAGGVHVGADVIAGSYVSFHSQEHVFTSRDRPVSQQGTTELGITIGDGCWLGARVTILDGTSIGARAVVAAGAVVKGDFPERSLIGGVPARLIRVLD